MLRDSINPIGDLDDNLDDLENYIDDEEEKKLVEEVKQIIEKEDSPEKYLQVPKKSPVPSPGTPKGEVDEPPSFANTLDEIATICTNEVAEFDPSSQALDDQPENINVNNENIENIPILNYKPPVTPPIQENEPKITEVKQQSREATPPLRESNLEKQNKVEEKIKTLKTDNEPSYEVIDEPVINVTPPENNEAQPNTEELSYVPQSQQDIYQIPSIREDNQTPKNVIENVVEEEIIVKEISEERKDSIGEEIVSEVIGRLSIGGSSSNSLIPSNQERQYTPLSFSSSDAQFYSPPDSPEVSLSERLRDGKPSNQIQVNIHFRLMTKSLA